MKKNTGRKYRSTGMRRQCGTAAAAVLALMLTAGSAVSAAAEGFAGYDTSVVQAVVSSGETGISGVDVSELFSDRDLAGEYDEAEAVTIELQGTSAASSSEAVTIDGSTVTVTDEGVYILSGTLTDGMIIVDAEDSDKVQLVLNGVSVTSSASAAIYVKQADKVFLTLAEGSVNTLANGGTFTAIDENNIDAVIYAKDDLTLNGSGTLNITSPAGHGIVCKDDLVITGGEYQITAAQHGISAKDSLAIADGNFTISAGKDALQADNDEDTSKGYLYIGGGTFILSAEDDGIHASSGLAVAEGNIEITKCQEGLEGLTVDILGGTITLTAADDGINAAGSSGGDGWEDMFAVTEGAEVNIQGGTITITASGDGIDSNGNITLSGGVVYVSGPENSGNAPLDYNGTASVTGGYLIASGLSGMLQNFSSAENQGVMMVSTGSQSAGTVVTLTDADGNELVSWAPEQAYDSVIITCPGIQEGQTYTVTAGSSSETVTMDSTVYGTGGGMGGMGGRGGREDGFGGREDGMGGRGGFPGGR